jgi:hypothetical protein
VGAGVGICVGAVDGAGVGVRVGDEVAEPGLECTFSGVYFC